MGKSLIITEKPSVARDIAAVFGNLEDHDGWFEGDDYIVTFAVGHLFELPPPEEVNPEWKAWTLDKLPMIPEAFALKPKQGHSERIRTIKKLAARADVDGLVNACDAGREGELIFREIAQYLGNTKPVLRLWLQSMTTQAIRNGFEALVPGEEKELLGQAAECRAWSDWLIGMNATRALTKRLREPQASADGLVGRSRADADPGAAGGTRARSCPGPCAACRIGRWPATFEHDGAETYPATWYDPAFKAGDEDEANVKTTALFDEARARAIVEAVRAQRGRMAPARRASPRASPHRRSST